MFCKILNRWTKIMSHTCYMIVIPVIWYPLMKGYLLHLGKTSELLLRRSLTFTHYSTSFELISIELNAYIARLSDGFVIDSFLLYRCTGSLLFSLTQFDGVYLWLNDRAIILRSLKELFFYGPSVYTSPELCASFGSVCYINKNIIDL